MIDRHPAGWVLGERRVMEDSAKALYDSYPDGEKRILWVWKTE